MPTVILRNMGALAAQMGLSRLFYFALVMVLSRKLGVEGIAQYAFAFSFPALVFLFLEMGLSDLIVRNLSRKRKECLHYVGTILSMRLAFGLMALPIIVALLSLLNVQESLIPLVLVVSANLLIAYLDTAFRAGFWGREEPHLGALAEFVVDCTGVSFAVIVVLRGHSVLASLLCLLVGRCVGFLVSAGLFFSRVGLPRLSVDFPLWKSLLRDAFPFLVNGIMLTALLKLDIVMVGLLTDTVTLGIFSAAFLILRNLVELIQYQAYVFYPRLSLLWETEKDKFSSLLARGLAAIAALSVLLSLALMLLAAPLMRIVFGSGFEAGVPVLRALLVAGVFLTPLILIMTALNASGRQWTTAKLFLFGFVLNLALNALLIPRYAGLGSAWATVASCGATLAVALLSLTGK